MIYTITYSNGVEVQIEASVMEDNGICTQLFREDGSVAYRAHDCEIVCCEPADAPNSFDIEETKHGVVLKGQDGATLAAYRNYK
ncbi:hypothetical protein [Mesorhizobium sp. B2-1-2]|uniref:hypothetical protein n=1 Tax=Mesorhizobium sp. B2-1-2 TaxID=2589973 RepID=UPI001125D4DA|nr:hypothetical protein [Mesorhizobium sp. B2-1-2]TPN04536.1 hypothetical protein FJ971_29790 [Mesorhizobium sp. B2-1-2]